MSREKKWICILISYTVLLTFMGYIAFFHLKFNPVTSIGSVELELLENENSKDLVEEALREEGKAFQMKRDLAIQSFNIILGAALGFLSATATFLSKNRDNESDKQSDKNEDDI